MIRLQQVSFRYMDSQEGVRNIDLEVQDGECVVLTGPSGGGKTTMTRLINGLAPSYYQGTLTGSIQINQRSLASLYSWQIGEEIGSVFQDPKSQFFSSALTEEVAFACENHGLSEKEIRQRTDQAIDAFALRNLQKRALDVLSSGEKQRVAMASVYALSPKIYVCDEPTANLDQEGTWQLAEILRKLKGEGKTIIIAEHRLAWLADIGDRYLFLSEGTIQWEKKAREMGRISDEERKQYGLREVREQGDFSLREEPEKQEVALAAYDLVCRYKGKEIFQQLDLTLYKGQITALTGRNGAGKTSLALILTGLKKADGGRLLVNGKTLSARKRRKHVWYSANDTGTQFFTNSVTEELLLQVEHSPERLENARELLKKLNLYRYKDAHPASLSGGQKQRLSIACGILSQRPILIFDEPTSGLDGGNMRIIAELFSAEAKKGKAILLITHDRELISSCCSSAFSLG